MEGYVIYRESEDTWGVDEDAGVFLNKEKAEKVAKELYEAQFEEAEKFFARTVQNEKAKLADYQKKCESLEEAGLTDMIDLLYKPGVYLSVMDENQKQRWIKNRVEWKYSVNPIDIHE